MTHFLRYAGGALALLVSTASLPAQPAAQPTPLPVDDWRQAWIGRWRIEYALDSIRPGGMTEPFTPGSGARTVGELTIAPLQVGREQLKSRLRLTTPDDVATDAPSFGVLSRSIALTRDTGGVVHLHFSPNVSDAGVTGTVRSDGRVATGLWWQSSINGSVAMGRLWLRRDP